MRRVTAGKRILVTGVSAGLGVEIVGGLSCEDCHVAKLQDTPAFRGGVRGYALDADNAKALWAKSEQMVGETF